MRALRPLIPAFGLLALLVTIARATTLPIGDAAQAGVRYNINCTDNGDGTATCPPPDAGGGGGGDTATEVKGTQPAGADPDAPLMMGGVNSSTSKVILLKAGSDGYLFVRQADGPFTVDLTKVNGTTLGATNPVPSQLSDGSAAYTATKTGQLPATLTGSGNLKVDLAESTASQAVTVTSGSITEASAAAIKADLDTLLADVGATNSVAAGSDTATADLGARLQRIAQRLSTLIGTDFSTATLQGTGNASLAAIKADLDLVISELGATNSSAAGSDTATADIGARLQRIAQRLTTLIATDFATSALQGTGNASLSSIDGKTPALSGGKVPVVDSVVGANTGAMATSDASIDSKLSTSNTNTGATAASASSIDSKLSTSNTNTATTAANTGTGATNTTSIDGKIATADFDSGAGTSTKGMLGIALPASGGPVAGGTASNPVRTDPVGTTPQPVNGTVAATQGTSPWVISGAVTSSGTVTEANGATIAANTGAAATSDASIDTKLSTSNTNTGATATSAASIDSKLSTSNTNTGATATSAASIDTKLSSQATAAKQDSQTTLLTTISSTLTSILSSIGTTITSLASIVTNTSTTATNTGTIAGAVSGGKMLTTETSAAAAKTDLDTIAGAVTSSKIQDNIAQVAGATPGVTNPLYTSAPWCPVAATWTTAQLSAAADNQSVSTGCTGPCQKSVAKNLSTTDILCVRPSSGGNRTCIMPNGDWVEFTGNTSVFFDNSAAPATSGTQWVSVGGCDP